ncbi:hypothetical protein [Pectobacterium brasiliense]|uniref:hypothetical protein n=1 Tax=Pectobacterium brasiliense TaxID=180957 RepID=UPI00300E53F4
MRYVNRAKVAQPLSLATPSKAVKMEIDEVKLFYQHYDPTASPRPKSFPFQHYKSDDVKLALKSLFDGKCAYCETRLSGDIEVEHFRPKGMVTEEPLHSGYWWLAHSWLNLLPSCIPCNQRRKQHVITEHTTRKEFNALILKKPDDSYGKLNHFPISGIRATCDIDMLTAEKHHLLDPTQDNPYDYLVWSSLNMLSVVLPKMDNDWVKKRALDTINIFALNRLPLVQERTMLMDELLLQMADIEDELAEDINDAQNSIGDNDKYIRRAIKKAKALYRYANPECEFTALAQTLVDIFIEKLQENIAHYRVIKNEQDV